jgi:Zn-dependent protease
VLILSLLQNPLMLAVLLTTLVVSLTVHEYAHAWSAFQLGDLKAHTQGRLSLDPRRHIDPMGALVFLLVGFGWARPVPIDPYRLGRRGTLLVSLAGPASNVLLAGAALLPLRLGWVGGTAAALLGFFAFLNLLLAVFNMLPVAPLDGWKVLLGVVPPSTAFRLHQVERYGGLVLLLLIFAGRAGGGSVLMAVMRPFGYALMWVLGGADMAGAYFG